ncbi:MAG: biotin--[acetyl-CoA-carboxylase] ligase [Clostridiales Family XIII bacterium]|nr:biotin--[acetyl-CoA-carboxylase] ligase [Clostridiales Family XIII bacterium]
MDNTRTTRGGSRASIAFHRSVDSTNDEAKRLIAAAPPGAIPFGTVVVADEQTAGRGRRGRRFFSPAANSLYISFILRPDTDPKRGLFATIAAATAVCEAMEIARGNVLRPKIKWVNDIFEGGKKVCGILAEAVSDAKSGKIEAIVIGIGVNINVPETDFPDELRAVAGSIDMNDRERADFIDILIENIFSRCAADADKKSILDDYRARSLILGKPIFVARNERTEMADALEIGDDGSLLVEYENGRRERLRSGEVSIRNIDSSP